MMNSEQRKNAINRLNRIEGQIRGVKSMIEDERYCIDILTQTRAIVSALRKVEEAVLQQHLQTCVADSMKSGEQSDQEQKIGEIMEVFSRFQK